MNESLLPPLPPPSGAVCRNCGAVQSAETTRCANCGAPMQAATSSSGSSQTIKTLASIVLGCGAILFGALGGCLALIGVMGGSFATDWPYFAFGVAALFVAVAFARGIARVQRKK